VIQGLGVWCWSACFFLSIQQLCFFFPGFSFPRLVLRFIWSRQEVSSIIGGLFSHSLFGLGCSVFFIFLFSVWALFLFILFVFLKVFPLTPIFIPSPLQFIKKF
jgi:hypothetical protein